MSRQYVHMSKTIDMAKQVGKRKDNDPIILIIDAKSAYNEGITFYLGNDDVYLANYIPSKFIKIL